MPARVEVSLFDRSDEKSSVVFYLGDNLDAIAYGDLLTDLPPIIDQLEAITLCEVREYDIFPIVYADAGALPSDPYAQREIRAMFKCVDLTNENRPFVVGVPCPDLTDLGQAGSDNINFSNIQVDAYMTALTADAVSPWNGTLSIRGGVIEGRNS